MSTLVLQIVNVVVVGLRLKPTTKLLEWNGQCGKVKPIWCFSPLFAGPATAGRGSSIAGNLITLLWMEVSIASENSILYNDVPARVGGRNSFPFLRIIVESTVNEKLNAKQTVTEELPWTGFCPCSRFTRSALSVKNGHYGFGIDFFFFGRKLKLKCCLQVYWLKSNWCEVPICCYIWNDFKLPVSVSS